MASIQILDEHLRTRIAAGEVIERPASVVKELVENSIDADADEIRVELKSGGIDGIRVSDNGKGISPDEIRLAVQNHATSKITKEEDLFAISTMGFRGEALPSIASVTRFSISSKRRDDDAGSRLEKKGEGEFSFSETGMADGTVIEADNIFSNVPVRRKFLKSPATELNHISQALINISLAFTHIRFFLSNDGFEIMNLPACETVKERVFALFGRKTSENLLHTSVEDDKYTIDIHGAAPAITKGNSKSIYLYVNGRYFRDKTILHAVREGYRTHIPNNRWPVVFIYMTVQPDLVDVNVHPGKIEVRFRESSLLHSLVKRALSGLLRDSHTAVSYSADEEKGVQKELFADQGYTHSSSDSSVRESGSSVIDIPEIFGGGSISSAETIRYETDGSKPEAAGVKLMQVYDSYIIAEYEDRVTVYDQHALHEGIMEQKLREQFTSDSIPAQDLLIPDQIDLPGPEKTRLLSMKDALLKFGFDIQDFSGTTVVFHSIPAMFDSSKVQEFINELLKADVDIPEDTDSIPEQFLEKTINRIACHSSVRAGQRLTREEMEDLLAQAKQYPDSASCAHGRPSSFDISKTEIEKRFQRR